MSKAKPTINTALISCHAPDAQQVLLAGTFNAWNPDANPMNKGENGIWSLDVELPPGRHEFKFVVDGEWCCDTKSQANGECPQCIPNDMGTMNHLCELH